jgi:hypothetical protein
MNSFFINRLKTFSIAEIPYRIRQLVISRLEERTHRDKTNTPLTIEPTQKILDAKLVNWDTPSETYLNVFGKRIDYKKIGPEDWNVDVFSGKAFPMSFSKKINIRKDSSLSAKCVWEINRLQFLMEIAIKYQQTGDLNELCSFIEVIRSWRKGNPYLIGINWYSNIEVNLRLITWFLCWEVLEADKLARQNKEFDLFVLNDWLPLIYRHCLYSYKNPSRYSSSNNHLIAEYAGLFIASSKWPFKESKKWIKYSQKGLEKEIGRQHSKNGVNKEEAAEYIQFITDFFLLAYIVGENSGHPFSNQYKEQLHKIVQYIYSFLDCKGNFPKYGDEDDGKCFMVSFDEGFNNFKSLLASGAVIFKDPLLKSKSNGYDIKNQLLFGDAGKKIFESVPDKMYSESSVFYKEEGHFIMRKKDNEQEVLLHFDAAPLGFLSIAAHGHADALSFQLHIDGQPFLVDSGTYTYHTEPEWRNYFIGTLAHNTIRVNRLNQAKIGGSTLWLQHYNCTVLNSETGNEIDKVKAKHDGYKRLSITHTREIIFDKKLLQFKIIDSIESSKNEPYFIELPFHVHPGIKVQAFDEHSFELVNNKNNGRNIRLQIDQKLTTQLACGQLDPEIIGWYSESFLHKEPCNVIISSLKGTGNISLETIISIDQI